MSLPFDFSATLEDFECLYPIETYEKEGQWVDGYWQETVTKPRAISGILLNVDEKKLEIEAHGRNVEEAYCLMYSSNLPPLFITDQIGKNIQGKQSYLLIDGIDFEVVHVPETVKNAGFRTYYAIKYSEQENEHD